MSFSIYKGLQQKIIVWLLLIVIVVTMAASRSSQELWIMWCFFPITFGFLYIVGKYKFNSLTLFSIQTSCTSTKARSSSNQHPSRTGKTPSSLDSEE